MKVLIQRVSQASVTVGGRTISRIDRGLLLLVGIEPNDGDAEVEAAVGKVSGLRLFADDEGKMNLDVGEIGGSLLVVSQFTLAGSLRKGRRPSFTGAAAPEVAEELVDRLCASFERGGLPVARGVFGADMAVDLTNDGPVTFFLELPLPSRSSAG